MHFGLLSFVGEEEAFPRLNVVDSPPEVAFGLPLFAISRKSDIGLSFFQCFFFFLPTSTTVVVLILDFLFKDNQQWPYDPFW